MLKSEFNEFLIDTLSSISSDIESGRVVRQLQDIVHELAITNRSGQAEYALKDEAFDNFNRLGNQLDMDREKVLFVYMQKHIDGITSYLKGHRSQREPVQGRIKDVIVYSILLWGMINENQYHSEMAAEIGG